MPFAQSCAGILLTLWAAAAQGQAQSSPPEEAALPAFGTTVVIPGGLQGQVYTLRPGTLVLPKFETLESLGSLYTTTLNIPPRQWTLGFPGITGRFEWFAIDYKGRFWIEKPGKYRFLLTSDDGSKLYIDDRLLIDNDGQHPPQTMGGSATLIGGIHHIRVSYFQGPREALALVLEVAGPGQKWRVFNTDEFRPPANPEDWKYSDPQELKVPPNPAAGRRKMTLADAPVVMARGLHARYPDRSEIPLAVRFIREALPKEGVNILILDFQYHYQFKSHPEVAEKDALSAEDVKTLVTACRAAGVILIPGINLLGHQSWEKTTNGLLAAHPEFDETPGAYPNNQGIYCRSYCPLHPRVHEVVFDLIDELAEACESRAVHVGMDEVFLLGEPECPRCRHKDKAELFAGEVRALHDHLAKSGRGMLIWGDRLLDGAATGIGKWEASMNGTYKAIGAIPKDVVICDWHYKQAFPTAEYFAKAGFQVWSCPFADSAVAVRQLEMIRKGRAGAVSREAAELFEGMLQTTWDSIGQVGKAYFGDSSAPRPNRATVDAVKCFRDLFQAMSADSTKR